MLKILKNLLIGISAILALVIITLNLLVNYAHYEEELKLTIEIALNPRNAKNLYYRGCVRTKCEDYWGAIHDFTQGIKVLSDDPKTLVRTASYYYQRGRVYEQVGKREQALADYQKSAEISQQHGKTSSCERVQKDVIRLMEEQDYEYSGVRSQNSGVNSYEYLS